MRILLFNDNKIVSRLISLTCEKNGIEFHEIEKKDDLGDEKNYDYIFIDGDFYTDELKEEIKSKKSYKYLGYIASKGAQIPDDIDIVLEKPFLPTDFLELIQNYSIDHSDEDKTHDEEEEEEALQEDALDNEFDFDFGDIEEENENALEEKEESKNEEEQKVEDEKEVEIEEGEETEQEKEEIALEDDFYIEKEEDVKEEDAQEYKDGTEDDALLDQISQELADEIKEKSETDENAISDFEVDEFQEIHDEEDGLKEGETILDKDDIEKVKHFLDEAETSESSKTDGDMQTNDFSSLTQEALLNALQEVHIKDINIDNKEEIIKHEDKIAEIAEISEKEEEKKEDMPAVKYDSFEVTEKDKNELEEEIQSSVAETLEKVDLIKKVLEDMEINITINFKSKK